jgi:hypothetical protein
MMPALERLRDIIEMHGFRRIVADAPWRSQKNHCRWDFFSEDHSIMSCAARHAMWLASCFMSGMLNLFRQEWIHGHGILQ